MFSILFLMCNTSLTNLQDFSRIARVSPCQRARERFILEMFSFILKASEEVCTCFIVLSETRGFDVSTFGMGLMRLPTQADGKIDRAEAIAMIRYALDHGVNYLDTAYPYHGGESELVLAEALKDGYRQKAIVVSKSPTWLLKEPADYDRLLDEQLEKLGVDYLDVYLLHSLGEENFAIAQKMEYKAFIQRAKAAGKIKYAGFSFHGDFDCFRRIVDDYDFDVCQIQLNILDENEQATVRGASSTPPPRACR